MPAELVVRRTSTGSSPTWQPAFSPLSLLSVFGHHTGEESHCAILSLCLSSIFDLSSGAQDNDEDLLLLQ